MRNMMICLIALTSMLSMTACHSYDVSKEYVHNVHNEYNYFRDPVVLGGPCPGLYGKNPYNENTQDVANEWLLKYFDRDKDKVCNHPCDKEKTHRYDCGKWNKVKQWEKGKKYSGKFHHGASDSKFKYAQEGKGQHGHLVNTGRPYGHSTSSYDTIKGYDRAIQTPRLPNSITHRNSE